MVNKFWETIKEKLVEIAVGPYCYDAMRANEQIKEANEFNKRQYIHMCYGSDRDKDCFR